MNAYFGTIVDGLSDSDTVLHIASIAVFTGASIVFAVLGFLMRRDINRADKDQEVMAASIVELGKKLDALKDKIGNEINDTRRAIDQLYYKAGLQPPEYPSR